MPHNSYLHRVVSTRFFSRVRTKPNITDLYASCIGTQIEPTARPSTGNEAETEYNFSLLAAAPPELLLQILQYVALADVTTYVRLSEVCKKLCYLTATEEIIWRELCKKAFEGHTWSWKYSISGKVLANRVAPAKTTSLKQPTRGTKNVGPGQGVRQSSPDEELYMQFMSSWRAMFILRPRIRFHGVYICNWGPCSPINNPPVGGTYHTFIRFYPNGTLSAFLACCNPINVIYDFYQSSLSPSYADELPWKGWVRRGRWRIQPDGLIEIQTQGRAKISPLPTNRNA
jgi:F-box protein 9